MSGHRIFSKMKRIEIVMESDRLDAFVALVTQHATGYTVVPHLSGFGEHGARDANLVLLVTVVSGSHLDPLIDALQPALNGQANIVLISDVTVLRAEHFIPEVRAAARRNALS